MVLFSVITLFLQLFVLFACCSGVGLSLVFLGVPVRISAWLLLGAALVQLWLCRHKFVAWLRTCSSNGEIRTLAAVILLTITFHGVVPIRQGLGWYYGKG